MNFDIERVLEKREIWERLMKVAINDGILTNDEQKLLELILSQLGDLIDTRDKALEDGILDNFELLDLLQIRLNLIKKMNDMAREDNIITRDEQNLITSTQDIIFELEQITY